MTVLLDQLQYGVEAVAKHLNSGLNHLVLVFVEFEVGGCMRHAHCGGGFGHVFFFAGLECNQMALAVFVKVCIAWRLRIISV